MGAGRLVSERTAERWRREPDAPSGSLATGLGPWHEASEGLWIGWPGDASRWTRFIQVAVPSRGDVDSCQRIKRQVEETVGRIDGARGTLSSTPGQYVHRFVLIGQLVALYCAADVMLVTPLRKGMNLVAKEFVRRGWTRFGDACGELLQDR